jgi:2-polyprenyl-3-methyl-5-hydroxy-6-metoxy-1,4-benzoquinol methylase
MTSGTDWRRASPEERQAYEHKVWGPWAAKFRDDRKLRVVDDLATYFGEGRHAEGEAIVRAVGDLREMKVLEIGCGPGGQIPLFALAGARVWAFDLVPEVVEVARRACPSGVKTRPLRVERRGSYPTDVRRGRGFGVLHT